MFNLYKTKTAGEIFSGLALESLVLDILRYKNSLLKIKRSDKKVRTDQYIPTSE
jgi:hypothetical protein